MPPSNKPKREPPSDQPLAEPEQRASTEAEADSKPLADQAANKTNVVTEESSAATNTHEQKDASGKSRSWYGGTWPRTPSKASPVTQLAAESIAAGGEVSARVSSRAKSVASSLRSPSRKPSSLYMSPGSSTRSLPVTGETVRVHATTSKAGAVSARADARPDASIDTPQEATTSDAKPSGEELADQAPPAQSESTGAGWRNWIPSYRYPSGEAFAANQAAEKDASATQNLDEAGSASAREESAATDSALGDDAAHRVASEPVQETRPRSWFGLWNGDTNTTAETISRPHQEHTPNSQTSEPVSAVKASTDVSSPTPMSGQSSEATMAEAGTEGSQPVSDPTRSNRWSFWPRGAPGAQGKMPESTQHGSGTDAAEQQPEETVASSSPGAEALRSLPPSRKRERPASTELPEGTEEDKISKRSPDGKTNATAAIDILPAQSNDKPSPRKKQTSNLLLPTLNQTFRAADHPSLLSRLASYFYSSKASTAKHVNLIREPPIIKHALAIGVHGYFPAPLLRTVIGQPRGTSIRFATNAADAIAEWARRHDCSPNIDKIALEGEGKIEERVELLWQLLLKHIDKIQEADFILVACHSQGVPVALQLVAKLIGIGCLTSTKVGVCAMAGINQGPFMEYKSRWIGGSAGELFDFASPNSKVSSDYEVALNTVLKSGVKMMLVGSIDDQLVSMDSATFGNAEHPCLFRAVFINGLVHAPTFVVHLVGFALKLRNLGIPDHGLIRELSSSLSGSFTGDGHSRLYEDPQVYDAAIEFALETTSYPDVPLTIRRGSSNASQNPYILPFAMRGVLEEDFVRSELHSEMAELLQQFDDWKPVTKPLKDVKFRLEGVRSKI